MSAVLNSFMFYSLAAKHHGRLDLIWSDHGTDSPWELYVLRVVMCGRLHPILTSSRWGWSQVKNVMTDWRTGWYQPRNLLIQPEVPSMNQLASKGRRGIVCASTKLWWKSFPSNENRCDCSLAFVMIALLETGALDSVLTRLLIPASLHETPPPIFFFFLHHLNAKCTPLRVAPLISFSLL